jgi:hypothetical protein
MTNDGRRSSLATRRARAMSHDDVPRASADADDDDDAHGT